MSMLAYKSNADQATERLRALFERRASDRIFAAFYTPNMAPTTCRAGVCDYPDPSERIAFWDRVLREHSAPDLEDDSVPCAYLHEFDQGLYGALLGGEIQFTQSENGTISSMTPPLLQGWAGLEHLKWNRSNPWFGRYVNQLKIFDEGSRGKFGISHCILINHMNLACELVGATEAYIGMIESPALLRKAVALAFDLNAAVQDAFFERVRLINGGTCSIFAHWIPGRVVAESIDPFHLTSPADFETWGRAPVERIFARYDGGVLHIHGNGRHLLKAAATVKGLKAINMGNDRGFPDAFDILPELKCQAGDLPLVVTVAYPVFAEALKQHKLCGGILYDVNGTPGIETANRCMGQVRAYRT